MVLHLQTTWQFWFPRDSFKSFNIHHLFDTLCKTGLHPGLTDKLLYNTATARYVRQRPTANERVVILPGSYSYPGFCCARPNHYHGVMTVAKNRA